MHSILWLKIQNQLSQFCFWPPAFCVSQREEMKQRYRRTSKYVTLGSPLSDVKRLQTEKLTISGNSWSSAFPQTADHFDPEAYFYINSSIYFTFFWWSCVAIQKQQSKFHGGPVVRTLLFHWRDHRFDPGWGTKILRPCSMSQTKRETIEAWPKWKPRKPYVTVEQCNVKKQELKASGIFGWVLSPPHSAVRSWADFLTTLRWWSHQ